MKTKTTLLATITLLACSIAWGGGLYIVSGSDFRACDIAYTVKTTEPNQEIPVTPDKVRPLGFYSNPQFVSPWMVKCLGVEHQYEGNEGINQGSSLGIFGTNADPWRVSFPIPGNHVVKIYQEKMCLYVFDFKNPYITSLYLSYQDGHEQQAKAFGLLLSVSFCENLKKVVYKNPLVPDKENNIMKAIFQSLTNTVDITVTNPEMYTVVQPKSFCKCYAMTNDAIYVNATNIGYESWGQCSNITYASFPKAIAIGGGVFNLGATSDRKPHGLRKLRLGDCLRSLGMNSFYGVEYLTTIEFVTSETDWIAAWNNHPIFPNWLGTATAIPGNDSEATITPLETQPSAYTSSTRWAKPTRLVLVRPEQN